jgi:signal transduction histidine kinase
MKFHAVSSLIPDRPEAKRTLETVIDQARQAITEGRNVVQGLRSSTIVTNDLARAIIIFGEDLDDTSGESHGFDVRVEGKSRDLVPLVRDEVYRIVCEALRNAFRHSNAEWIDVEIRYDRRQLRVRVRDNGKGIDPSVLEAGGRPEHYGLSGMHERAKLAGGKLVVWSELDSGTEIEIAIPASVAYARSTARRWMFWGRGT